MTPRGPAAASTAFASAVDAKGAAWPKDRGVPPHPVHTDAFTGVGSQRVERHDKATEPYRAEQRDDRVGEDGLFGRLGLSPLDQAQVTQHRDGERREGDFEKPTV